VAPRGSILLVDDEEKILKTLSRALREDGHEVVITASSRDAQLLLERRGFDLLVVDNRMPERSGLEIIRDLAAATPEGERPQVVMMTAHASVESAIKLRQPASRPGEPRQSGKAEPASRRKVWFEADKAEDTPVYDRATLMPGDMIAGPAVIEQLDSTTLLFPGDRANVDPYLNLIVEIFA